MTRSPVDIAIADVLPTKAKDLPWTWADEEANIRTRQCLCCGRPGHYQEMLEAHMVAHGVDGLGIVVDDDGYLGDGHHRVVAARRLGIERLPVETHFISPFAWRRRNSPAVSSSTTITEYRRRAFDRRNRLHWPIRLRLLLIIPGSWKWNRWVRNATARLEGFADYEAETTETPR